MSWRTDSDVDVCPGCNKRFILTRRRHHCRLCGNIMCNKCSHFMSTEFASQFKATQPVRKINFLGRNLFFSRKIDKSWFQLFGARLPPVVALSPAGCQRYCWLPGCRAPLPATTARLPMTGHRSGRTVQGGWCAGKHRHPAGHWPVLDLPDDADRGLSS